MRTVWHALCEFLSPDAGTTDWRLAQSGNKVLSIRNKAMADLIQKHVFRGTPPRNYFLGTDDRPAKMLHVSLAGVIVLFLIPLVSYIISIIVA